MLISETKRKLLEDDLAMVREALDGFGNYRFSDYLIERMKKDGLTASEFARRCRVSHAAVGKWRSGGAKPVGKERVKEAGLALSLAEEELNTLLLSMGYSGLYEKNPLDNACILTIRKSADDPVGFYRNLIEQFRLKEIAPSPRHKSIPTSAVKKSFAQVYTESSFGDWLSRYAESFSAFSKTELPNKELVLYMLLFLGGASINKMYETGELPVSIRNLLYPLTAGSQISQKGLRGKLISFGLLRNMPEEEIDRLLSLAKLRPFLRPETRYETAVLTAVRCAHSRYAGYEFDCLNSIYTILSVLLENAALKSGQGRVLTDSAERRKTFYSKLRIELEPRLDMARQLVNDYDRRGRRGAKEKLFEKYYTEAGASSLACYVRDMMIILTECGDLDPGEEKALPGLFE